MADDRNRWLDGDAADRLLRGEPVGPVADHRIRAEAARLRAALDAVVPAPAPPGRELPGEAAAVAAFLAARPETAPARPETEAQTERAAPAPAETVVRLGSPAAARPRRRAPIRLGLAAAIAGVAIGGVAAAAGAGLIDRDRHHSAGPAPAVSLTTDANPLRPDPADGTRAPGLTTDGSDPRHDHGGTAPGTPVPGSSGQATPGTGGFTDGGGTGGTGRDPQHDTLRSREPGGDGGGTPERDPGERIIRAADLCRDFRAGRISAEGRERLSRAAKGVQTIGRFCDRLLDGTGGDTGKGDREGESGRQGGDDGSGILEAPPVRPGMSAVPAPPAGARVLSITPDARL
ncbi:hypothetical protein [Streptomyces sp. NPDC012888]|uniref:hypothetical protein n=1 Tax=Streptomyces sp. NPDC012888 TaxID=3364855 RepID=UPI003693CDCC